MVQLTTQPGDVENDPGSGGGNESSATVGGLLTPKDSHRQEDAPNEISTAMQGTLTLDSAPAIVSDGVEDDRVIVDDTGKEDNTGEVMTELAAAGKGDTQASGDDEVCYYYDSSQYDKVLRKTFRAIHGDMTDGGNVSIVTANTPNLDEIINGHPLRMYKRTAKVLYYLHTMLLLLSVLLEYIIIPHSVIVLLLFSE